MNTRTHSWEFEQALEQIKMGKRSFPIAETRDFSMSERLTLLLAIRHQVGTDPNRDLNM